MIFRAVFWIGLVSLLAPHEPDLGLGRPGAGTSHTSTLPNPVARLSRLGQDCGSGCAGGLGLDDVLHWRDNPTLAKGLAHVKAEITADQRARAAKAQHI
jgi:hypothetical protein